MFLMSIIFHLHKLLSLSFIQNVLKNVVFLLIFKNRILKIDTICILLTTFFDQI